MLVRVQIRLVGIDRLTGIVDLLQGIETYLSRRWSEHYQITRQQLALVPAVKMLV